MKTPAVALTAIAAVGLTSVLLSGMEADAAHRLPAAYAALVERRAPSATPANPNDVYVARAEAGAVRPIP